LSFLFSIPSEKLRLRLRLLDGGVAVAKYPGVQYNTQNVLLVKVKSLLLFLTG
jgi:hypothetical protein